ncbi:MAG: hypothetical protein ACYTEQ_27335, partial [Planctomycetota bacterium]|jgi:hypothetical protein
VKEIQRLRRLHGPNVSPGQVANIIRRAHTENDCEFASALRDLDKQAGAVRDKNERLEAERDQLKAECDRLRGVIRQVLTNYDFCANCGGNMSIDWEKWDKAARTALGGEGNDAEQG